MEAALNVAVSWSRAALQRHQSQPRTVASDTSESFDSACEPYRTSWRSNISVCSRIGYCPVLPIQRLQSFRCANQDGQVRATGLGRQKRLRLGDLIVADVPGQAEVFKNQTRDIPGLLAVEDPETRLQLTVRGGQGVGFEPHSRRDARPRHTRLPAGPSGYSQFSMASRRRRAGEHFVGKSLITRTTGPAAHRFTSKPNTCTSVRQAETMPEVRRDGADPDGHVTDASSRTDRGHAEGLSQTLDYAHRPGRHANGRRDSVD
jgi:hypothetical protein